MRVTTTQFEEIPAAPTYDAPAYTPAPFPEERISDGLGHWWDSAIQDWRNDDGSLYNAQQSYAQPQDDYFGNFDAYAPENMGTQTYDLPQQPSQADWYKFDNSAGTNNAPFQDPGYESPNNPYWMQDQGDPNFLSDLRVTDPQQTGYQEDVRFPTGGGMLGSPLDAANDWFFDPIAETGAQAVSPFMDRLTKPNAGILEDWDFQGWKDLGNAAKDSGGNPFKFGEIQNENFDERPWYQQLAAGAVFDPTNLLGFPALRKLGLIDDAASFAPDVLKAGKFIKGATGADEVIPMLDNVGIEQFPAFSSGVRKGAKALPPERFGVVDNVAYPRLAGAAVDFDDEFARLSTDSLDDLAAFEARIAADKGKPVTLFHGSPEKNLDVISPDGGYRRSAYGAFFSPNPDEVERYGDNIYAILGNDAGMVDLREPNSMALFGKYIMGMEGDDLDDLVRWSDEGQLYQAWGGPGLQNEIMKSAKQAGFKGVVFNDATLEGVGPSYVYFKDVPVGAGLSGGADVPPPRTPSLPTDTALNPPRRKLLDALDAERKFRTSGEADALISQGRVQQAKGIEGAVGNMGDSFADNAAAIRGGARTGKMLPATQGLGLDDDTMNALLREAVEYNGGKQFNNLQVVKALDKLQKGERLQPAEIKNLRAIFGDDVGNAIQATNANRISSVAELTPDDIAEISRKAEVDGRKAATAEVQATRQHELADNLQKQLSMDPTNKRLKTAVDDARARAIAKENEADRILAERAERATANLPQRTEAGILKAETKATGTAKQAEQADKVALRTENKARINASDEQMITRAKDVIAKLDMPDNMKSVAIDTIEAGAKKQRVLLDGMGEEGPSILRKIYAGVTGEVTDSYTSQLLTQRGFIQNALEAQGYSKATAKQVAKLLQDADIRFRFGDNVPKYVTDSLEQAKFDFAEGGAIKGLADISQELKNTQFGIGDLAVFGQQGAKLGATNAPQFVAGLVNRILNMAHLGADTGIEGLAKSTAYQLDGLARKSVAITDIANEKTLVSRLGPAGRLIDSKVLVPATKWLTDLQFDHILGKAREITYEGNLVLAKLVGEDISNPAVRLRAAEWANAASGAGKLAQQAGRANAEKAFLLSPSMRRAQLQQITQVMKGLSGAQGKQGAIYAIATVSSMAGALAAAKAINDRFGLDEFVWDPSKPGFGNITLPGVGVVNPFSQEQLVKVFAKSLDVLRDGDLSKEEVGNLAKEWSKLGISSASPGIRPFLAQIGVGYDPGKGYAFGDLGDGKGFKQKLIDAAPIPPIAQQVLRGDMPNALDVLGVANYPESQYDILDRKVKNDPEFGGKSYRDLTDPLLKAKAQEKYGQLDPFGPEGKESAEVLKVLTGQQTASDTKRDEGKLTPEQWRKDYTERKEELAIRNDQIYSKLDLKTKDPILGPYYAAIDSAKGADGKIDWDAVDAYVAQHPDQAEYIATRTGLVKIDTPKTQEFKQTYDAIKNSGYFERSDENWAEVVKQAPEWSSGEIVANPKDYPSYDAWKQAALKASLASAGKTLEDIATVTKIETWLAKQSPAKGMDYYGAEWKEDWVAANPREAYDAWRYGYYNPKAEIKTWLARQFE